LKTDKIEKQMKIENLDVLIEV